MRLTMANVILARYSLLRREKFPFPKMTSETFLSRFGLRISRALSSITKIYNELYHQTFIMEQNPLLKHFLIESVA